MTWWLLLWDWAGVWQLLPYSLSIYPFLPRKKIHLLLTSYLYISGYKDTNLIMLDFSRRVCSHAVGTEGGLSLSEFWSKLLLTGRFTVLERRVTGNVLAVSWVLELSGVSLSLIHGISSGGGEDEGGLSRFWDILLLKGYIDQKASGLWWHFILSINPN